MRQAQNLLEEYMHQCLKNSIQADALVITHGWLREWRLEYGISFRKPNRKWTVPRAILEERLQITWENVYRVRRLAQKVLKYDLAIENSVSVPHERSRLEGNRIPYDSGCRSVGLKRRARCVKRALVRMHLLCFRHHSCARSAAAAIDVQSRRGDLAIQLQKYIPNWAPWLTVVTSPKASYREDDVLNLIETVLPKMEPGRSWRILLLDAYASHLTERVRKCAWHRGYVVITHGGGASSICQPNDTGLHAPLKRQYIDMETEDNIAQQRIRHRCCPSVRRSDIISWMACIWFQTSLHLQAARDF
jgi:hypothetical protein